MYHGCSLLVNQAPRILSLCVLYINRLAVNLIIILRPCPTFQVYPTVNYRVEQNIAITRFSRTAVSNVLGMSVVVCNLKASPVLFRIRFPDPSLSLYYLLVSNWTKKNDEDQETKKESKCHLCLNNSLCPKINLFLLSLESIEYFLQYLYFILPLNLTFI